MISQGVIKRILAKYKIGTEYEMSLIFVFVFVQGVIKRILAKYKIGTEYENPDADCAAPGRKN